MVVGVPLLSLSLNFQVLTLLRALVSWMTLYVQIQLKSTRFYRNYQFLEGYEPQCLKIAQNVAFDIASEACYVYILIGQKFIKNAKNNEQLGEFLKTGQIVLPDRSILIGQKLAENANSSRQKS